MNLRADEVKAQVQSLLAKHPELREDDEALVLSLESETEASEVCFRLIKRIKELEAEAEGKLKELIREYQNQKHLMEFRAETLRATVLQIMEAAGLSKWHDIPVYNVSIRHNVSTQVIDRDQIPADYRRQPPWEPMLNNIKADLKAGKEVPGCVLSNPEPSLYITRK